MANISNERKTTYYVGMGLMILGIILFLSVLISAAGMMSEPSSMMNDGPPFVNAVIGMVLIVIGRLVMTVGAKGAAGSGLVLDPTKAREDLKPYNEAKGGMINDIISNIDTVDKIVGSQESKQVIKIKCRSCGSLNDEDAVFCKSCGNRV